MYHFLNYVCLPILNIMIQTQQMVTYPAILLKTLILVTLSWCFRNIRQKKLIWKKSKGPQKENSFMFLINNLSLDPHHDINWDVTFEYISAPPRKSWIYSERLHIPMIALFFSCILSITHTTAFICIWLKHV